MRAMPLRGLSVLLVLPMLVACGRASQQSGEMDGSRTGTGDSETLTGRVYLTGTDIMPMVALRVEGQSSVNLVGGLSDELRQLSGATVEVQGMRRTSAPMDEFEATDYRVVEVDGQEPMVGMIGARGEAFMLYTEADTIPLMNVPDALKRSGAKVWVLGRREGSGYYVQSFGVIRDP